MTSLRIIFPITNLSPTRYNILANKESAANRPYTVQFDRMQIVGADMKGWGPSSSSRKRPGDPPDPRPSKAPRIASGSNPSKPQSPDEDVLIDG